MIDAQPSFGDSGGNIMFDWSIITIALLGLLFSLNAKGVDQLPQNGMVFSKISFSRSLDHPEIQFANVSNADELKTCPLETLSSDIGIVINQLVEKVRDSVTRIKTTQTNNCQAITDRLTDAQTQLNSAISNQFLLATAISSTPNQATINTQVQQAGAINLLLLTASNLMQHQCIESLDNRMVIQRILGQIITLGGLYLGGWQGIGVAAGGQIIGNLPLFRNELDSALELFQKYDEVNERGCFLCLFRQMQKNNCLLFAEKKDKIVNGLDISFNTGPAKITFDSIQKIKLQSPKLFHDANLLREIQTTITPFLDDMNKTPDPVNMEHALDLLKSWCRDHIPGEFEGPEIHLESIPRSLAFIRDTCSKLNSYSYFSKNKDDLLSLLDGVKQNLKMLANYYLDTKKQDKTELGSIVTTLESMKFFETLRNSIRQYSDTSIGNQKRLNYFRLVSKLGDTLARSSFNGMFRVDHQLFANKPLFASRPDSLKRIQKRSLIAMLDLCQTLDPTLACLYASPPQTSSLFKDWESRCVGPKSQLCKNVLKNKESEQLLKDDPRYWVYFQSLCGRS